MDGRTALAAAAGSAGLMSWAVRGRSARYLAGRSGADRAMCPPSPSPSTTAPAKPPRESSTSSPVPRPRHLFPMRRTTSIASPPSPATCAAAGHEIGNHSHTHPYLFFRSPAVIEDGTPPGAGNHRTAHRTPRPFGSAPPSACAGSDSRPRSAAAAHRRDVDAQSAMIGSRRRMRWSSECRRRPLTVLSSVFTMDANFAPSPISAPPWKPSGAWFPCCWTGATNLKRLADSYVRRIDPARDEGDCHLQAHSPRNRNDR